MSDPKSQDSPAVMCRWRDCRVVGPSGSDGLLGEGWRDLLISKYSWHPSRAEIGLEWMGFLCPEHVKVLWTLLKPKSVRVGIPPS